MFAYYAKWIPNFSDKIKPLTQATTFPLDATALDAFNMLKKKLESATLCSIDESLPFVVECDASEVAISATLNQGGRPVAFMSRTLQGSELHYPAVEKEAMAVVSLRIEGLRDGHAQERRREETRGRNVKYQRESENKRSDVIFRLNLTSGDEDARIVY